jgi:hypothetical protein
MVLRGSVQYSFKIEHAPRCSTHYSMGNAGGFGSQVTLGAEVWRCHGWVLHDAQHQIEGNVSVFVYHAPGVVSAPPTATNQHDVSAFPAAAQNFFKRFKTMRHPYLLPFKDGGVHQDKIYIVTERVTPLEQRLNEFLNYNYGLSWGIYQIAVRKSRKLIQIQACYASAYNYSRRWCIDNAKYTDTQ